jgi:hypothetical protein
MHTNTITTPLLTPTIAAEVADAVEDAAISLGKAHRILNGADSDVEVQLVNLMDAARRLESQVSRQL